MDDKAVSCNSCKKRIVGVLFALLMLSFAIVFLTFAIRNIKTLISDCKTVYYCFDYNFLNCQTDEDFETREGHLRTGYKSFASDLLSNFTLFNSCKSYMLDVYGICAKFQGLYKLHNTKYYCTKLLNGGLSVCADYDDMVTTSKDLTSFKEYLDERSIPMLYVIAPHKNYKYHSLLPRGVVDYETDNCNRLRSLIEGRVPFIDNRELFKNDPEQHYQLFYVGDSHWKVQYAYLSYCQIMQYMEEHFPITFEKKLKSIENFLIYSSGLSNDLSKQYGRFYLPQEPKLFMKPRFKTHVRILSNNKKMVGDITDVDYAGEFNMELLAKGYMELRVNNPNAANKKKLMVIGDSFSSFVMSFLSLSFEQIEFHAVNYYRDSLADDIEKFQPDYVICIFTSRQTLLPVFNEFSK